MGFTIALTVHSLDLSLSGQLIDRDFPRVTTLSLGTAIA